MAPSEHHIEVYIAVVGGDHSKLQSPPSEGRVILIHLLVTLTWVGTLCVAFQAELDDLADQDLWQLMEDLCQEITLCELHAPPSNPQPTPWEEPSGSSNTNGDDPEVTFLRGEDGFP